MDFGENKQNASAIQRSCAICSTTKTPLWRGGPAGPKSLCNACGIKYRKKSGDPPVWIAKQEKKNRSSRRNRTRVSFKVRLSASNRDVLLQRLFLRKQRKLAEEEEAAVLLMALSCGLC